MKNSKRDQPEPTTTVGGSNTAESNLKEMLGITTSSKVGEAEPVNVHKKKSEGDLKSILGIGAGHTTNSVETSSGNVDIGKQILAGLNSNQQNQQSYQSPSAQLLVGLLTNPQQEPSVPGPPPPTQSNTFPGSEDLTDGMKLMNLIGIKPSSSASMQPALQSPAVATSKPLIPERSSEPSLLPSHQVRKIFSFSR